MKDYGELAEKLSAQLRPQRVARWNDLRTRVKSGTDQERDIVCDDCLKKYSEHSAREFSPSCFTSMDIQIRSDPQLAALDADEQSQWWYLNDVIAWARVEIDWEPRWYQIEALRCTARRKIFRMGRQIGKTELLAILALYHVATQANFRVVILCPYQDQVDIIFDRIRKYIQKSQLLSNPEFRIRDRMNPHEIEFAHPDGNSSMIGITAGVRTGQKGDKSRGQTPNLLILDEGDMLDDETLESVLASLTGTGPIAQMIVSSTPTGRRGLFFKWCVNKGLGFREFHYTSMVSPNWSAEMELFYRETYSENSFSHEFLAEFGEMEIGLFQHKHIEASLREYSITNSQPIKGEIYAMGADWNRKGIGVHIMITGYCPETGKLRPAYKEVISAGEFTQHAAVDRMAELNAIWSPNWIYVDEGDGTTQIEALKIKGMNNPQGRLHRKVKGIDFGSKVLVRDPLTKAFVKKMVKPLVVDMAVRHVERLDVILPKSEDTSTGLVGQMREFRVLRYGREGQPVFSDEKEHTLVAWMLTVYAFVMEMTDLAKITSSNRIAFTGHFGEDSMDTHPSMESREVREKRDKISPKPRIFAINSGHKDWDGTMAQLMGKSGRSFRESMGNKDHPMSGRLGRTTWERERKGDPKDD